jgi:methylenetetrahydrofolate dehydrogenase (NADP+)/methenyltetrahydrofolate cyclohydrolase
LSVRTELADKLETEQALIMDGRALAKEERARLKEETNHFTQQHGFAPGLAVLLVGDDHASIDYSGVLVKNATELGMHTVHRVLPATTTSVELITELNTLNQDKTVHGISIQWPLPQHITFEQAIYALDPRKDVEGYHPLSTGKLYCGLDTFIPATPLGGMRLLEHYGYDVYGKTCLVVGCGVTVGRPLIALLTQANASVLMVQQSTPPEVLRMLAGEADFIFGAAGAAHLIKGDMVKPGAVVVDFGMSFIDGKLYGDVEVESVKQVAAAVTASPSVSGRLTTIALLENVIKAANKLV